MGAFTKAALFTIGVVSASVFGRHPWFGRTLNETEVKSRFGSAEFSAKEFKRGDESVRARMAYALMKDKTLIGKSTEQIWELLGESDGHYFSEAYPAYLIHRARDEKDDSWQIVFLIDNDRRIKQVIVHRNCCE